MEKKAIIKVYPGRRTTDETYPHEFECHYDNEGFTAQGLGLNLQVKYKEQYKNLDDNEHRENVIRYWIEGFLVRAMGYYEMAESFTVEKSMPTDGFSLTGGGNPGDQYDDLELVHGLPESL